MEVFIMMLLALLMFLVLIPDHAIGLDANTFARQNFNPGGYKGVRAPIQKIASMVFGCSGLDPGDVNITCTHKLEQRHGSGIDCTSNVPLKTKAIFVNCPPGYALVEDYQIINCKFPGKWDNEVFTCDEVSTVATTTKAANATTKPLTKAANTTKPANTTKAAYTTKPANTTTRCLNTTTQAFTTTKPSNLSSSATNVTTSPVTSASNTAATSTAIATTTVAASTTASTVATTVGANVATSAATVATSAATVATGAATVTTAAATVATTPGVTTAATTAATAATSTVVTTVAATAAATPATSTVVTTSDAVTTAATTPTTTTTAITTDTPVSTTTTSTTIPTTTTPTTTNDAAVTTTLPSTTTTTDSATTATRTTTTLTTTTQTSDVYGYPFGTSTYKKYGDTLSWDAAEKKCVGDGGHLAIIGSEAELAHLTVISGASEFFVGLDAKVKSKVFVPVDGSTLVVIPPWTSGQPDDYLGRERCAQIWFPKNVSGLNDLPCSSTGILVICEKSV